MNEIELNVILYYADFLSLKEISIPVTDNCKYFYIHGTPVNSCFILDLEPIYDVENPYFVRAYEEYSTIKNKFGEEGVDSFVEGLANLSARGAVDAEQMLKAIHQYSTGIERKQAFKQYYTWKKNKKYKHTLINEDGLAEEKECTMYTYHVERMLAKQGIFTSNGPYPAGYENKTVESLL